jgi:D-alanyl-lipoteichoic acid acyltransferase DltB (MBOAT superfamily)
MIYDYGMNGLNLPICMMFNYCRITSLACCIKDGTIIREARKKKGDTSGKIPLAELGVNLKSRELAYAVEAVPSFFEFLSYVYFCGAAISGPWYEFRDFNALINRQGDFANIPSTWRVAVKRYFEAWACVAVGAIFAYYFPVKFMMTDEFRDHSIPWKIWFSYGQLKGFMYRTYMVGWCLMEVGPLASGLCYNGKDEHG